MRTFSTKRVASEEEVAAFLERLGQAGQEPNALPLPRRRDLVRCPDCGGTGVCFGNASGEVGDFSGVECAMCGGTGRVS